MRRLLTLTYLIISAISFGQVYEIQEVRVEAKLQTIVGVNEKSDDFSPVILGKQLYFTSNRPYNKHNVGENNWDKLGYSNIFWGTIRSDEDGVVSVRDIKLLSNKLNNGNHTGPISFTKNGDTLFFTQVVQITSKGERIYKPQLFSAIKTGDSWSKIKRMPFCDLENSFAHPSYDAVKKRLYFVSDKPGGKGKNDIYYVELIRGGWSTPVNLELVNSDADELFPYVVSGNIFFSSDRVNGQGQLDIYYNAAEPTSYPIMISGLNSPYDDFGISVLPDLSAGYFSSNRLGNDDIYYFTLDRKITVKNQIAGTFTYRTLGGSASNLTVQLFNENGEFVYEEKTDSNGYFIFDNIKIDSNFSVRLAGEAQDEMTLEFYNQEGETQASFILNEAGAFKYKKLFYDQNGIVSFLPDDMKNQVIDSAILSSKIVLDNDIISEVANQTVNLVDQDKQIIFTTTTDSSGNFYFRDIPLSSNYSIDFPGCQEALILYIYNSQNQIHTQLKCNGQDEFVYRRLRPDLNNNLTLLINDEEGSFLSENAEISGNFAPVDKTKSNQVTYTVCAYSEDGILLASTRTDSIGNFSFTNLSSEKTYKFTADTQIQVSLTLYDRYGKQIARIQEEENHFFIYRPLGFQTESNLSLIDNQEGFDLNLSSEYEAVLVFFETNQSAVKKEDLVKLTSVLKLLKKYPQLKLSISAYADATASDEYNFILSQKRGEWIAAYLAAKGIDPARLSINAYGETKLIDPENDSINRRAELRIYL